MPKKSRNSTSGLWLAGARLRTLPLAVVPVALGMASAIAVGRFNLALSLLALAVALLLQIAVNYSNDYSDGIRGTDAKRVGPLRLTGSGAVPAKQVRNVALGFFALAAVAGLAIVVITGFWWLVIVGVACLTAGWYYTGGKHPYGYAGLGDVAVFIFFGLVATIGTSFIQLGYLDQTAVLWAVASGLFACAVLMVNNIRDINTDVQVGKRTLAVKLGKRWASVLFVAMLWLPYLILALIGFVYPGTILAWFSVLISAPATLIFVQAKQPKELILVLKLTSFAALAYALLVLLAFSVQ